MGGALARPSWLSSPTLGRTNRFLSTAAVSLMTPRRPLTQLEKVKVRTLAVEQRTEDDSEWEKRLRFPWCTSRNTAGIHRVAFLTHPNKRTHNYEARSSCFGGRFHKCWEPQGPGLGSSALRADLTPHNASDSGSTRLCWAQSGQKRRAFLHSVHFSTNQKIHSMFPFLTPASLRL